jgi:hypothetical protein
MIIALNGYAGSGKDTVGNILQYLSTKNPNPQTTLKEVLENPIEHQWWLEERSNWEIKKWAGKLKQIASILTNIPIGKFEDQEFKQSELPTEWDINLQGNGHTIPLPFTVREFLQRLGTDAVRNGLHRNAWVNALMSEYVINKEHFNDIANGREVGDGYPKWIITDTRFPNEAEAVKQKGGIVVRVNRNGVKPVNSHPSEVGLDNWDFDHVIENNGSIEDLIEKVKAIL